MRSITLKQISKLIGKHPRTIRRWIVADRKDGERRFIRPLAGWSQGKTLEFDLDEFNEWWRKRLIERPVLPPTREEIAQRARAPRTPRRAAHRQRRIATPLDDPRPSLSQIPIPTTPEEASLPSHHYAHDDPHRFAHAPRANRRDQRRAAVAAATHTEAPTLVRRQIATPADRDDGVTDAQMVANEREGITHNQKRARPSY